MRPSRATGSLDHGFHLSLVGHVGGNRDGFAARCGDFLDGALSGCGGDFGHDDLCALGSESVGQGQADSVACPGNNCYLILKP